MLTFFKSAEAPAPQPATGFFTDTTLCIGCKACEVACKQWNQLPADGFDWAATSYDNTHCLSGSTWRHVAFVEQMPAANLNGGHSTSGAGSPGDLASNGSGDYTAGAPYQGVTHLTDASASGAAGQVARWLMMSDVCKHCEQAPCEEACPTGAILYNEFHNVYVQQDICNGCGYCVSACPFGVLSRTESDGRAHKCTLCYDRQRDGLTPACAKACPTASIQFGPVDELRQRARRRVGELQGRGEQRAYLYGDQAAGEYSALNAFFLLTERPEAYNLPAAPRRPRASLGANYLFGALTGLALLAFSAWSAGKGNSGNQEAA